MAPIYFWLEGLGQSVNVNWISEWKLTMTAGDAALSLAVNIVAGILIFLAGLYWSVLKGLIGERRLFRRLFGMQTLVDGNITITLDVYRDTRLLDEATQKNLGVKVPGHPDDAQHRFYKIFPDGHITVFSGAWEEMLGFCSARAAMHLVQAFSRFLVNGVDVTSDVNVASRWEGSFVNLGSSYSNLKTDQVKHLSENSWVIDDGGKFTLVDGRTLEIEDHRDKGVILRIRNPHSVRHSLFVCAGLGEWGTSGAAWFLARHWKQISRRFRRRNFALFLSVDRYSDESATEVMAFSEPTWFETLKKRWLDRH